MDYKFKTGDYVTVIGDVYHKAPGEATAIGLTGIVLRVEPDVDGFHYELFCESDPANRDNFHNDELQLVFRPEYPKR